MLTWQNVLPVHGLLRGSKSWCPQCYQEWQLANKIIYEPLLWALKGVDLCLRHQQPLVSICPYCHTSPAVLSQIAQPGHCSHCAQWLGGMNTEGSTYPCFSDTDRRQQQLWRAEVIGELLASAPILVSPPSRSQIAAVLRKFLNLHAMGNLSRFARLLRMTIQVIWSFLQGKTIPRFDSLLQLCFMLRIHPLEFLTTQTIQAGNTSWFERGNQPTISRRRNAHLTMEEKQHMRQVLEKALTEVGHPVPSLNLIAQHLGIKVDTLQKHFPDLCQVIIYRRRGRFNRHADPLAIQQALEDALISDERVPLEAISKKLGHSSGTLRKYCPELCQAVVERHRNRYDYSWVQQQLQQTLASREPIPSLRAIARQLGCSKEALIRMFPDLSRAITRRWHMERRQKHEQELARICAEVREAVAVIHQQGRYPSAREVAKLLSNPRDMRSKEARATWHSLLDALEPKGE